MNTQSIKLPLTIVLNYQVFSVKCFCIFDKLNTTKPNPIE